MQAFSLILESCAPEELPQSDKVDWNIIGPSAHGDEVELVGSVADIMDYVRENWGDGGDPEWFAELPRRMTVVQVPRTILVHLNVTVPVGDDRNADEIADAILAAIEVGSDDDSVRSLGIGGLASGNDAPIAVTLAEEI